MNIADDEMVNPPKRKRLHGACDACRKKKIKCNSAEMPDNRCTNCSVSDIHCTHADPRRPKKKETQQAYIRRLEDRLEQMHRFLQTAFPDQDIDDISGATAGDDVYGAPLPSPDSGTLNPSSSVHNSISNVSSPSAASEDDSETDDLAHIELAMDLSKHSITTIEGRFFGQSSGFMLAKQTTTAKNELTGTNSQILGSNLRRPVFWDIRPWEKTLVYGDEPRYTYPEEDLLWNLVSLYFEHINQHLPLLHRPTFEKSLILGQHLCDPSFGMTVLLVCATASRYSEDPRVYIAGDSSGLSCGWHYFCQVPVYRNILLGTSAAIYDLQYYCLAVWYLLGTSIPNAAWGLLGLAIRLAMERGIHRRMSSSKKPGAEEELLKRSFWCLVCMDRMTASFFGRACILKDEDFDVDYPIECDDEYWAPKEDSEAFQQPAGKLSVISAFVYQLKLYEILASTLKTLYSTKKSKIRSGLIGNEWEHRIVAELDSSLNKWKDSLPEDLRWDPNRGHSTFFRQTVWLFSTFFYIQMQVHRPFLTKKSDLSLVSLAICTNAARSCSHLMEVTLNRGLRVFYHPMTLTSAFISGLIVVLNLWGGQKSGLLRNTAKEMANVQICLNVLNEGEKKWHLAGRLYDLLKEIGSLNNQPPGIADQTMDDLSMESDNQSLPVSSSSYPTICSPIGAITGDDWGLNNLFPSQMGIIYANPAVLPAADYDGGRYVSFNDVASQGWAAPSAGGGEFEMDEFMDDAPLMYPNGMINAEMLSLWSEASATFSEKEWDAYIANINQNLNPF